MSEEEDCTFTVVRTSDAAKKQITVSLATKLSDLKQTLASEFNVACDQRIFYMGRELKSGGRSLAKLGLGRHDTNVLHMHVLPTSSSCSSTPGISTTNGTSGAKRRMKESDITLHEQHRPSQRCATESIANASGVIEIIDNSDEDDEIQVLST